MAGETKIERHGAVFHGGIYWRVNVAAENIKHDDDGGNSSSSDDGIRIGYGWLKWQCKYSSVLSAASYTDSVIAPRSA